MGYILLPILLSRCESHFVCPGTACWWAEGSTLLRWQDGPRFLGKGLATTFPGTKEVMTWYTDARYLMFSTTIVTVRDFWIYRFGTNGSSRESAAGGTLDRKDPAIQVSRKPQSKVCLLKRRAKGLSGSSKECEGVKDASETKKYIQ